MALKSIAQQAKYGKPWRLNEKAPEKTKNNLVESSYIFSREYMLRVVYSNSSKLVALSTGFGRRGGSSIGNIHFVYSFCLFV